MSTPQSVSIIGCGWLGAPLAQRLLREGYRVAGSSTRTSKVQKLAQMGVEAQELVFQPQGTLGNLSPLLQHELLILNIPPGRRNPKVAEDYSASLAPLVHALSRGTVQHLLFIGSTSVYGNASGTITEDSLLTPASGSGKALVQVETQLRQHFPSVTTLHPGGLVGPDRHPGRFLAGKTDLANGDAPVNLIHQEDLIGLILAIIERQAFGETFLGCAPEHPSRRAFYTHAARALGLPPPTFLDGGKTSKRIHSERIGPLLNYDWKYPHPFDMLKAC